MGDKAQKEAGMEAEIDGRDMVARRNGKGGS